MLQSAGIHVYLEDLCCEVQALVKFMFVYLPVLQSAGMHDYFKRDLCCKVQALVKSVQRCNLLL